MNSQPWMVLPGIVVVLSPLLLAILLGGSSILDRAFAERTAARLVQASTLSGLLAAFVILGAMLATGTRHFAIDLGHWFTVAGSYHFSIKFVFDRLSVPFAILSLALSGTIGAFAGRYLHRERGFNRFFVLYAIFALGMVVASLAGTIETLLAGWELVGLSSTLLIAFYQDRPSPARNALWVWCIYRVSDAALLLAAVAMHQMRGEGDFRELLGPASWPEAHAFVTPLQATVVGSLLLVAAAGKSALVPFSGWLPRAMEGPTPSSAVFYGALSVHLGAFLLMRVSPLLERSIPVCVAVVGLGLATSVLAHLAGSVQTDIKSVLSFASLTQVGLIVAEVGVASGLGWAAEGDGSPRGLILGRLGQALLYASLVHLLGHACMRTLQFLRAPTLLHDYHTLENAIGTHLPRSGATAPGGFRTGLYRMALERGHLDSSLSELVVAPFVRAFRRCDALERRWTDRLAGTESRESDRVRLPSGTIEELS